jgi:hypothetical protein
MPHPTQRISFHRSHVSLGGLKYMAGTVASVMLAEHLKTPEHRYALMAGISFLVGLAESAWTDHINAEREARRAARGK